MDFEYQFALRWYNRPVSAKAKYGNSACSLWNFTWKRTWPFCEFVINESTLHKHKWPILKTYFNKHTHTEIVRVVTTLELTTEIRDKANFFFSFFTIIFILTPYTRPNATSYAKIRQNNLHAANSLFVRKDSTLCVKECNLERICLWHTAKLYKWAVIILINVNEKLKTGILSDHEYV